jgi:hypothetical protein
VKRNLFLLIVMFLGFGIIFGGAIRGQNQQKQTPAQQLQQANIKIAEQNVIILDIKAERNAAVVEVAKLREQLAAQRNGIIESEKLLQKAIDNDEKIDYYALSMLGWKLNIPDSTGSKSKGGLP